MKDNVSDSRPAESTLRVNKFDIGANLALNQVCGNGQSGTAFSLELSIGVKKLDESGFVIEVENLINTIRVRFSGPKMIKASCEELTLGVINIVHDLVGSRLTTVSANVFNRYGSVITVWKDGDQVPRFPREATEQEVQETHRLRSQKGGYVQTC